MSGEEQTFVVHLADGCYADFAVIVLTQKKVMVDSSNRSTDISAVQRFSPNQPFKRVEYRGT